jgi:hypothetical protein
MAKRYIIEVHNGDTNWEVLNYLKPSEDLSELWDIVIKEGGWKFVCLRADGTILMTRNGYLNSFRNKEVTQ